MLFAITFVNLLQRHRGATQVCLIRQTVRHVAGVLPTHSPQSSRQYHSSLQIPTNSPTRWSKG